MTDTSNGGPAFPRSGTDINVQSYPGMTLRDWFAGQALHFCLAEFGGNADDQRQYAEAAYQIADAMLKERDK